MLPVLFRRSSSKTPIPCLYNVCARRQRSHSYIIRIPTRFPTLINLFCPDPAYDFQRTPRATRILKKLSNDRSSDRTKPLPAHIGYVSLKKLTRAFSLSISSKSTHYLLHFPARISGKLHLIVATFASKTTNATKQQTLQPSTAAFHLCPGQLSLGKKRLSLSLSLLCPRAEKANVSPTRILATRDIPKDRLQKRDIQRILFPSFSLARLVSLLEGSGPRAHTHYYIQGKKKGARNRANESPIAIDIHIERQRRGRSRRRGRAFVPRTGFSLSLSLFRGARGARGRDLLQNGRDSVPEI